MIAILRTLLEQVKENIDTFIGSTGVWSGYVPSMCGVIVAGAVLACLTNKPCVASAINWVLTSVIGTEKCSVTPLTSFVGTSNGGRVSDCYDVWKHMWGLEASFDTICGIATFLSKRDCNTIAQMLTHPVETTFVSPDHTLCVTYGGMTLVVWWNGSIFFFTTPPLHFLIVLIFTLTFLLRVSAVFTGGVLNTECCSKSGVDRRLLQFSSWDTTAVIEIGVELCVKSSFYVMASRAERLHGFPSTTFCDFLKRLPVAVYDFLHSYASVDACWKHWSCDELDHLTNQMWDGQCMIDRYALRSYRFYREEERQDAVAALDGILGPHGCVFESPFVYVHNSGGVPPIVHLKKEDISPAEGQPMGSSVVYRAHVSHPSHGLKGRDFKLVGYIPHGKGVSYFLRVMSESDAGGCGSVLDFMQIVSVNGADKKGKAVWLLRGGAYYLCTDRQSGPPSGGVLSGCMVNGVATVQDFWQYEKAAPHLSLHFGVLPAQRFPFCDCCSHGRKVECVARCCCCEVLYDDNKRVYPSQFTVDRSRDALKAISDVGTAINSATMFNWYNGRPHNLTNGMVFLCAWPAHCFCDQY